MKTTKIIAAAMILFSLVSCESELEKKAELYVTVAAKDNITFDNNTITVQKGTPIDFLFTGEPDFITFFSGEFGKEYRYHNRVSVNSDEIESSVLSFNVWAQFGNNITAKNSINLYYSETFTGISGVNFDGDKELVEGNTWNVLPLTDSEGVSASFPTSPASDATKAVHLKSDLNGYIGKTLTLALKYNPTSNVAAQPTWYFTSMCITNTLKGSGDQLIQRPSTFGFTALNLAPVTSEPYTTGKDKNNITSGYWDVANIGIGNIKMSGGSKDAPIISTWLISRSFGINQCDPDVGNNIKNISNRLSSYSHTYDKAGTYTATFIGSNGNYEATSSVVREMTINVIE